MHDNDNIESRLLEENVAGPSRKPRSPTEPKPGRSERAETLRHSGYPPEC